jgi:ribosomal protein S18 acetylase RimI-like enzyme
MMDTRIEPYEPRHRDTIVQLSLRAWAPVFESLKATLDQEVYGAFFPDWRVSQQRAVEDVCDDAHTSVWVAVVATIPVGFVAVRLHQADRMGEIFMLAVDPDAQGRGIGGALTAFALDEMREAGMVVAMVETGGDPGHAPARRTYVQQGFRLFPVARYFKRL